MDERVRTIQEYVFLKYIEGARLDSSFDEDAALQVLEEHYNHPENRDDSECVYLGVLFFEVGYEKEPEAQIEFFRRAKYWLDHHLRITGEEWDAVDDRLADLNEFFESHGIDVDAIKAPEPVEATPGPIVVQEVDDHGPMMLVTGGSFVFRENNEATSLPSFYIDKYPVTNRQYEAFCRATGYRFPKYWTDKRFSQPKAPVVGVSVNDALKYARWVGKQLPTEEQWEKACRGSDDRIYPWGDEPVSDSRACFGRDPAEGSTDPVNTRPEGQSPYGVQDLLGNAWEWTATTDSDPETVHIIKGGCYNDQADFLNGVLRLAAVPKDKFETIGFRCVKSA